MARRVLMAEVRAGRGLTEVRLDLWCECGLGQ